MASTIRQILFILITSSSAGFMALSWPRGPGCPGGASGAQKRVPRRGEPAPGRFRTELDPVLFTEALRAPTPGLRARGVQGAGVAVQVWRCVAPAARSCRSASPLLDAPPPRLCWRLRPPLPPCGPGDRDARRKVPPPPCTGLCDCPGPPPSLPRQKLLHCAPVIYIFQGWVLPNATRSPRRGEGAGELGGRGRAGAERRLPPPLPETWSRPAVSPGVRRAQRAPAGSQKPSQSLGGAGPLNRGCV